MKLLRKWLWMLLGYPAQMPVTGHDLDRWWTKTSQHYDSHFQKRLADAHGQLFEFLRQQDDNNRRLNVASEILGSMEALDIDKALSVADELIKKARNA